MSEVVAAPSRRSVRAERERTSQGTAQRPGWGSVLGESALWFAALVGAVCLVLVIVAHTAGITLIMFKTGSMAPTIPAGSVAVVQAVPAATIELGDIVTVDREGQLPVTHRVTSVRPGASAEQRIITMRGDANRDDDPRPYEVSEVRIVRFSVEGLAPVIVAMGNPMVLAGLTLGASLLVGWAFWPRARPGEREASP